MRTQAGRYVFPGGLAVWLAAKGVALTLFLAGSPRLALLVYLLPDPWLFWQIMVPQAGGFGPVASRFRTSHQEIWLTIDDGPDPVTTPRVLDLLDHHRARATFFLIGERAKKHPHLVSEIARRGHALANHTHTHSAKSFWCAGPGRTAREIDACNRAIQDAGSIVPIYFRPPVGIKSVFIHPALAKRGMIYVAWTARGYDSISSAPTATRRILHQIKPGAIVLLHEGKSDLRRVQVIESVLHGLAERQFTTVIPARETLLLSYPFTTSNQKGA